MTEVESAIHEVRLTLEHANAVIELLCHCQLLITCNVSLPDKWTVMGAHLSDVGILSIAEFGIVVARLGIDWWGRRRCGRCRVSAQDT